MKRPILIIILFVLSFTISSDDGFIGLSNKVTKSKDQSSENLEIIDKSTLNSIDEVSHNYPIIPTSFYIGELGDFNSSDINRNDLLNKVNNFWLSIQDGLDIKGLNPAFEFIFKNVYSDILIKKNKDLKYWYLGYVHIDNNRSWIDFEVHFREKMYVGTIYLDFISEWLITDLQMQELEEGYFDPSSPN